MQTFQTILQFGNPDIHTTLTEPNRYLAITDNIGTKIRNCYNEKILYKGTLEEQKKIVEELERKTEIQDQETQNQEIAEQEHEGADPEYDTESLETPEGAYKQLYQEVFEKDGFPYDCRYNAKGNFYGMLSEDKGKPNENTPKMDRVRTVVYDHISKNEKCQTFVYYETYYTDDGAEYTTKFLDFYEVDMITGKVYAGDKHGWSELGNAEDKHGWSALGNAEYRNATGE